MKLGLRLVVLSAAVFGILGYAALAYSTFFAIVQIGDPPSKDLQLQQATAAKAASLCLLASVLTGLPLLWTESKLLPILFKIHAVLSVIFALAMAASWFDSPISN